MGLVDTKVVHSTANVVFKVESQIIDLDTITILFMIIAKLVKLCKLHNR